jgi:hypothetical protein
MNQHFSRSCRVLAPVLLSPVLMIGAHAQDDPNATPSVTIQSSTQSNEETEATTAAPNTVEPSSAETDAEAEMGSNLAADSDTTDASSAEDEENTTPDSDVPAPDVLVPTPTATPDPRAGRLTAESIRYEGGVIVAESPGGQGVVFETPDTRVQATSLRVDTINQTVSAVGKVQVERRRIALRKPLVASSVEDRGILPGEPEAVTETLRGENFNFSFKTQQGSLDNARLELTGFSVDTSKLTINGKKYTARDVVLRPGGLTAEEEKIYGTPPFSLRAKTVTVENLDRGETSTQAAATDPATGASSVSPNGTTSARPSARGSARRCVIFS